ncbi:MAG: ABC transporter permease [Actinobacteria bacterium]|nr:ABC transporter permease [Actinomycetota bacterium]
MKVTGRSVNPVLARELKERLRTRRATIVVVAYLAVLAVILQVVYSALSSSVSNPFSDPMATQSALLGRSLFETLLFFMLLLVAFIVPGLTADAVTGERERQTLVPLQVSLLAPRSILAGKLLSSLAFVTLLVLATLPLLGVSFILGGVSLGQLVRGVVAVLATGVVLACLALACSSFARRTQGAMVLAYGCAVFLMLGTALIYGAQAVVDDAPEPHRPSLAVLTLNPLFTAADVTGPATGLFNVTSPLEPMRHLIAEKRRNQAGWDGVEPVPFAEGAGTTVVFDGPAVASEPVVVGPDGIPPPVPGPEADPGGIPFWARSLASLGVLAGAAFAVAVRRLRTPSPRA